VAGGTVIIDDASDGGSDAGAWRTHIAHTPALRAQCEDFGARPSGRNRDARFDGSVPSAARHTGEGEAIAPFVAGTGCLPGSADPMPSPAVSREAR
jgi:hypothetical protein